MAATKAPLEEMDAELELVLGQTDLQTEAGYNKALSLLKGLAAQLERFLNGSGREKATVSLELGPAVSQGQEYRMVIQASTIGLKDYVLRAFVPAKGFPVTLEYLSEEPRPCNTEKDLSTALVDIVKEEQMMARLLAVRQALADETLRGPRSEVASFRGDAAVPAQKPKRAAASLPTKAAAKGRRRRVAKSAQGTQKKAAKRA